MKSQKIKIRKKYKGEVFQSGQLVKCINNENITFSFNDREAPNYSDWDDMAEDFLELGKIYKVHEFDPHFHDRPALIFESEWGEYDWFYPDRFVSLTEERRKKLEKLNSI